MSRYRVTYDELWVPWEIVPADDKTRHWVGEIPDELVERFHKAQAELEEIWDALRVIEGRA